MKLMKYMLALAVGGLATHLVLKYRRPAQVPEGLGSFGPDPLEGDVPATDSSFRSG